MDLNSHWNCHGVLVEYSEGLCECFFLFSDNQIINYSAIKTYKAISVRFSQRNSEKEIILEIISYSINIHLTVNPLNFDQNCI